jgi:hypothetical protein
MVDLDPRKVEANGRSHNLKGLQVIPWCHELFPEDMCVASQKAAVYTAIRKDVAFVQLRIAV